MVKVGYIKSDILPISTGVPQGSILGPLLFLLYINDIAYLSESMNIDLYADDSTLYKAGLNLQNVEADLQNNLVLIEKWCSINNMLLHPDKTKCMVIGTRQKLKKSTPLHLTVSGKCIENVKNQKVLGVYIENNMSWKTQTHKMSLKLNSKIALLRRISYYLTQDTKILFYNAYIMSTFDYCCTVWGKGNQSGISKIVNIQKRAARIILCKSYRTPSSSLFKELKWLPFQYRCKYYAALLVFKSINNQTPSYISDLLKFSTNDKYNLRSSTWKNLSQLTPRTNYLKDTFSYYSREVWNDIPLTIRSVKSINSFKHLLKTYLFNLSQS